MHTLIGEKHSFYQWFWFIILDLRVCEYSANGSSRLSSRMRNRNAAAYQNTFSRESEQYRIQFAFAAPKYNYKTDRNNRDLLYKRKFVLFLIFCLFDLFFLSHFRTYYRTYTFQWIPSVVLLIECPLAIIPRAKRAKFFASLRAVCSAPLQSKPTVCSAPRSFKYLRSMPVSCWKHKSV